MGITSIIALLILSSGVTGTIMTIIWILFCKIGKNYLHTRVINFSLKIVLISFYIPSMFLIMIVRDKVLILRNSAFLYFTKYIETGLNVFMIIILCLFIIEIGKVIIDYLRLRNVCKSRMPVELDITARKLELSKKFKVKRTVKIYKAYAVFSPFTYGIIKPAIYLPVDDIESEYLNVLLTHELFHNKQYDFIWKPLSTITKCIHWINPLAWFLEKEVDKWSEAGCDDKCCTKGEIEQGTYFKYLNKTLDGIIIKYNRLVSHFKSGEEELQWREKRMAEESEIKDRKIVTIISETVAIIISCLFIYTVADVSDKLYFKVFLNTTKKVAENETEYKDLYDEEILYLSELEKNGVEFKDLSTIVSTDTSGIVTGSLRTGESGASSDIYLDENINLNFAFIVEPQDRKVKIGIIFPDGVIKYISNDTIIGYDFLITQSGKYRIYVLNNSGENVEISISYAY
ncbi:MAG: M56 family metallopeptidase [Lachnospiraceae bacterium]|nr:M56 family metallopeptidase [Lachnospiraceae bacterium]